MSKFLYITDQDEHTDHSFIGPLFQKYLTKHFDINTVFFSNTKELIEIKNDGRVIVPEIFKTNLLENLEENHLKLSEYDFVVVRNSINLLKLSSPPALFNLCNVNSFIVFSIIIFIYSLRK